MVDGRCRYQELELELELVSQIELNKEDSSVGLLAIGLLS